MPYDRFTLTEFDRIVSGDPVIDWTSLKENASYNGKYSKDPYMNCSFLILYKVSPILSLSISSIASNSYADVSS